MSLATAVDSGLIDLELTTTQVANLVGLDPSTIRSWAASGRIPCRRDDRRQMWIRADQLEAIRQMRPGAKPCPQCQLLARLLLQWGDSTLSDLAPVAGGDPAEVRRHLEDLVRFDLAQELSGETWRLTVAGARLGAGQQLPALVPVAADTRTRPIDDLPNLCEYVALATVIAERGPISAAAASRHLAPTNELNEDMALRRARRLERARLIYRPRPHLWEITPQGRSWLAGQRRCASHGTATT